MQKSLEQATNGEKQTLKGDQNTDAIDKIHSEIKDPNAQREASDALKSQLAKDTKKNPEARNMLDGFGIEDKKGDKSPKDAAPKSQDTKDSEANGGKSDTTPKSKETEPTRPDKEPEKTPEETGPKVESPKLPEQAEPKQDGSPTETPPTNELDKSPEKPEINA